MLDVILNIRFVKWCSQSCMTCTSWCQVSFASSNQPCPSVLVVHVGQIHACASTCLIRRSSSSTRLGWYVLCPSASSIRSLVRTGLDRLDRLPACIYIQGQGLQYCTVGRKGENKKIKRRKERHDTCLWLQVFVCACSSCFDVIDHEGGMSTQHYLRIQLLLYLVTAWIFMY